MVSSAKRIVVIMPHEKRKMVNKLDYLTSPGFLDGPRAREKAGLTGGGPSLVVTNLCQMDFDPETKRIRLATVHPSVTADQVVENSGFDLIIPAEVPTTEIPTYEEIDLLRAIDPTGIYIPRPK
jgi:acyl CoA:acetate/3-ketoacid CoA transferase beta subunit